MKQALFAFFLLSLCNLAQAQDPKLKRTFSFFDELNGKTSKYQGCDNNDPNAPEYCKDLYGYICAQKKKADNRGDLDKKLLDQYWRRLPRSHTHKQFNDTAYYSLAKTEEAVRKTAKIRPVDVQQAFDDSKAAILRFFSSSPLIKAEDKDELVAKVSNVKLTNREEYVQKLVSHAKKNAPHMNEEEIKTHAYKFYMSACGMNGLEVNAFYEGGSLVLCPGLMLSMSDYGRKPEEIIAALRFTIGHEIGHAIDTDVFPHMYGKMRACYEKTTGDTNIWQSGMAAEIASDYWGALAMSYTENNEMRTKKLAPHEPDTNARIIALSVDGFCETTAEDDSHPDGALRINENLRKHPYISRALNCAPASEKSPYCSLSGEHSH
jgi:hypothetical protein